MDWDIVVVILLFFTMITIMMFNQTSNYDTNWRVTMKRGEILNPISGSDLEVFFEISDDDYVNYTKVVRQNDPYFRRTYPTILHDLITTKDSNVYGPYLKTFMSEMSQVKTSLRSALVAYEKHASELKLAPRTVSEIRTYLANVDQEDLRVFQAMSTLTDAQLLFTFNRMYVADNIDPAVENLIIYEPTNKNLTKFLNEKVFSQTAEVQGNIDYTYINTYIKPYLPTQEFIIQQANAPSPAPTLPSPAPKSPSSSTSKSPSSSTSKSPSPAASVDTDDTKTSSSSSSILSSTGLLYSGLSSSCSLVVVALLFMVMMKKKSSVK